MVRGGDRIVALREKLGLTQGELAVKIGISRAPLFHYEKQRRTPDYNVLTNLADFFGVSADSLLGRAAEPAECSGNPVKELTQNLELSGTHLLEIYSFTANAMFVLFLMFLSLYTE